MGLSAPAGDASVITRCRICGSTDLELVLDYGRMPLAGGFVRVDDPRAVETYPLRLARCPNCTLMQLLDTVAPSRIFAEYSYASSTNPTLVRHFEALVDELDSKYGLRDRLVVEFGCNDGILMRPLAAARARVIGIDPSDVARIASQHDGWQLYNGYFTPEAAREVRSSHGPAWVVTGNNVCAHVDDLHSLFESAALLLDSRGVFVFEVHYQGDLLELVQFDTVYHEHTCYHSLRGLDHLLRSHDLAIRDVARIPIHSGSIRVTASHASALREPSAAVQGMLAAEENWDVTGFAARASARRDTLRKLVLALRGGERRVVAYGASGRATVLLNFCGLGPEAIQYVTDLSPLRQGKVVPGVLVPIVDRPTFRSSPPDFAILTAWNYEEEIRTDEQAYLRGGGRFIIPLPEVRLAAEC